jgi:hypothetical protein
LADSPESSKPVRHQILYADQMWRQQRWFAGFLLIAGVVTTGLFAWQGQLFARSNLIWVLYVPSGLLLGGAFLLYRWRSSVRVLDTGVKVSTLFRSVVLDYDSIRTVKVQPLRNHFQDRRSRLVAPVMKQQVDKNAAFIRLRGDDGELDPIKRTLGSRLMFEDTIAVPVPDPDALAWEIAAHLPERTGQNLGGGRRRKRRH